MEIEHQIFEKIAVIFTAKENGKVIKRRTYFLGWGWDDEDLEKCRTEFIKWLECQKDTVGSNNTTK